MVFNFNVHKFNIFIVCIKNVLFFAVFFIPIQSCHRSLPYKFPLVFKPMGNAYTDGPILSERWFNKVFLTMRILGSLPKKLAMVFQIGSVWIRLPGKGQLSGECSKICLKCKYCRRFLKFCTFLYNAILLKKCILLSLTTIVFWLLD